MSPDHGPQSLSVEADRCVKCGLCLPDCPTYRLSRTESDSPRGRIALADALARGTLAANADLLRHLDACLLCRRCEQSCPSGVRFGRIMDQARELTLNRRPRWLRLAAALLSRRRIARFGVRISGLLPDTASPGGKDLAAAARRLARRASRAVAPTSDPQGPRIALFRGCVGDAVQPSVLDSAQQLLGAAGAQVSVPTRQTCCGAMHQHLGDSGQAKRLAERNRQVFAAAEVDAVLSLASGCGVQLDEQEPALTSSHHDISSYLAETGLLDGLVFQPLARRALLHIPCTQARMPGVEQAVLAALSRIPQLEVVRLDAGSGCCGAAGLQLLSHSEQGQALREPLLATIRDTGPDLLITSNPGCALHLAAGLGSDGPEVLHPVELLARQLDGGP